MPTGGRREPVRIDIADGLDRYGQATDAATISTWAKLEDAQAVGFAGLHDVSSAPRYRLRIAFLDRLAGAVSPARLRVTVRGQENRVRSITDPDGRRRWQVIELA